MSLDTNQKNQTKGQWGGPRPNSGRPKGSSRKPKITDHMTEDEAKHILAVAIQKAVDGDTTMQKFILEQFYGKAMQRTEIAGEDGGPVNFFINPEVAGKNLIMLETPSDE